MRRYFPLFRHLFSMGPDEMTYEQWLDCRDFADDWIKNNSNSKG